MSLSKMKPYIELMRLDKPIGIFLLLWPTLWALWLANAGMPSFKMLFIFVLGVILMRSAGCVINDIADRKFDGKVFRTRNRPLVTGRVTVKQAVALFVALMCSAFMLVQCLNGFAFKLAWIGAALAMVYPFLKRVTHLPQFGLGLAFAWGVPMVFAAQNETVTRADWLVFFVAFLWPIIYDTMYAMTDREDDQKIGVKSTAILFAEHSRKILATFQLIFLFSLSCVGVVFQLNYFYYVSIALVAVLFLYQQTLIKHSNPADCFKAFLNNHWVGFCIFLGLVLGM